MKKTLIITLTALIPSLLLAGEFTFGLKAAAEVSGSMLLGREISIEYSHDCSKCPLKCSFSFFQESFDSLFWGKTNRFALKWNFFFGSEDGLLLKAGPGVSLSTSFSTSGFSPDIYAAISYWILYASLDTLIFSNGMFAENEAGFAWRMWGIKCVAGFRGLINSGNKAANYLPGIVLGVFYAV
jgi:hypothetical protein